MHNINTRQDLDAIAGTPEHAQFMQMLQGSMWTLYKNDAQQKWELVESNDLIERFGFTRADFPGAVPPDVPEYIPEPEPEPPTQFELDQRRYQKRAAVQSELIAWMAADNMSRVRSGVWTVADLTSLMADPAVTAASDYMGKLSYELAAQAIQAATTPLLTPAIKSAWISKLQDHFYLEP